VVRRSVAVAILSMFAGVLHAGDLAITRAAVEPASVLPGVPFWISVTFSNSGKRAAEAPSTYLLEVRPSEGTPFMAQQVTTVVAMLPSEYTGRTTVPAGSSLLVEFGAGDDLGTAFLFDQRLWVPGKYVIRLIFGGDLVESRLEQYGSSSSASTASLVSPPIELAVEDPAGVDAEAWAAVLEATHHRASLLNAPKGGIAGQELWRRFPESRYAPYFIRAAATEVWRNGGEHRLAKVMEMNETIEHLDATGILGEEVRLGRSLREARRVSEETDLDAAIGVAKIVRRDLERLAADPAVHEHTRIKARLAADRLESADAIRERFRAGR
jgi:hypothetical protein